ncbi:MAG: LysR family transcriptional regulator, partial [Erysipelotrichaceae bacterium]|nr:LysR family transcriptional regulator [Erysipelotrichaceae bacterium]
MNTKYIESVLELAKTRNFSRAAENLFISQPSLTYQINAVEQEIGVRIFDRSGKGASVTPAGEQFIVTL